MNLPNGVQPTIENVCSGLREDQQMITLFSENYVPVNCRSSLEGVWQFAYQVRNRQIYLVDKFYIFSNVFQIYIYIFVVESIQIHGRMQPS